MIAPAMTLAVYTVVFGVFLKNGIPNFVIFLFSGLLLWNFFQTGVHHRHRGGGQQRRPGQEGVVPPGDPGPGGHRLGRGLPLLPVLRDGALHGGAPRGARPGTSCGCCWWPWCPRSCSPSALGIFLASVNVYLRDTQHLVEVLVGAAWFWACPIVYSYQHTVAPKLAGHHVSASRWLYFLNPMTPLVMTFQRVLYNKMGHGHPHHSRNHRDRLSSCPSWPWTDLRRGPTPSCSASRSSCATWR